MKRILIVKITSLGDVVMAQPVVSDLRRAFPGVIIDWATDAAFADIPTWNPDVSQVFSAPLRQFKKMRNRHGAMAILRSVKALRQHRYDAVLDVHGAYKSAIVSFLARGVRRYGYRQQDLGESGAGFAYSHRMNRPAHTPAVQGMRVSVAEALGYPLETPPIYGLGVPAGNATPLAANTAIFLHGASKDEKNWPIEHWVSTGQALAARGLSVALPWSSPAEHDRATQIVAQLPNAVVLPRMNLIECAQTLAQATLVVGVDTGLTHLAHAFRRPSVMIFTATARDHFGIDAPGSAISLGGQGECPSVAEVWGAIEAVLPMTAPVPTASVAAVANIADTATDIPSAG
jgi:heptosyltransferase-1